jgi:hypothetical protein
MRSGVRDNAFRVERRLARRHNDAELRQLRSLQQAYASSDCPELLIFGDSAMFWTTRKDTDRRHLAEILRDELDPDLRLEALVGASYGPRIVIPFLRALQKCQGRPSVIIVPTAVVAAMSTSLSHPQWGYEKTARVLHAAIESGIVPKSLQEPSEAEWEAYDRLPAPSLIGVRRTVGEMRLFINAVPATRWQHAVRLRHLMDYYNAERLTPESPGIRLIAEMATKLRDTGLPSVGYISPVNYEMAEKLVGGSVSEIIRSNAELIEATFTDAAGEYGSVVNAVFDCPGAEFGDPIHLTEAGRTLLAASIAAGVRPHVRGNVLAALSS